MVNPNARSPITATVLRVFLPNLTKSSFILSFVSVIASVKSKPIIVDTKRNGISRERRPHTLPPLGIIPKTLGITINKKITLDQYSLASSGTLDKDRIPFHNKIAFAKSTFVADIITFTLDYLSWTCLPQNCVLLGISL